MNQFEQFPSNRGAKPKNEGGNFEQETPEIPPEIMEQLRNNPEFRRKFTSSIGEIDMAESQKRGDRAREIRLEEVSVWLEDFKIEGLSLGDPRATARGLMEQYGVYQNGKHLGDIYSNGIRFDRSEFHSQVARILSLRGIDRKSGGLNELLGSRVTIKVNEKVLSQLVESGVKVSGDQWTFRNIDISLYGKGENALVRVTEKGPGDFVMEITEKEGKIIQYDIRDGIFDLKSRREV